METDNVSESEERSTTNGPVLKILAVLVAVSLALCLCVMLGGGLAYGVIRVRHRLPVAEFRQAADESGVVIASVIPGGPAAQAGLARGDILLALDDQVVRGPEDLVRRLSDAQPGDRVRLTVLHGDDRRVLTVILGEHGGRAFLGVVPCGGVPAGDEGAGTIKAPGAVVVEVMPDSPAEKAGLQEGDRILAVDDQALGADQDLAALIAGHRPGDEVTLDLERPGEGQRTATVVLASDPEEQGSAYLGVRYSSPQRLGDDLLPGAPPREWWGQGGEAMRGALVVKVVENGPAAGAGLQEGDVITALDGKPLDGPEALSDTIALHEPGDTVTVTVHRPGQDQERQLAVTLAHDPGEEGKPYLGVVIGSFFGIQDPE